MISSRQDWLQVLQRICDPVLRALAEQRLKMSMPVEAKEDRSDFSHLEAAARTLYGIAPWLELAETAGEESASGEARVRRLQDEYSGMARTALASIVNPDSPDYGNFGIHAQTLVEAAFLAHTLLRAPKALWGKLEERDQANIVKALKRTRSIRPAYCNWLLFSAIIEVWLYTIGEEYDPMRIDYALRQHEDWYKGDGIYGDGPEFHWDYYNSYVIHPMLMDILSQVSHLYDDGEASLARAVKRARRYGAVQERLIAPDGSFPAVGRSIAYRCGAFHLLAQLSLQHRLPESLSPAQVRCALQAVISRSLEAPGTFDDEGWLKIGLAGSQPSLGEHYISTGSLYLCTTAFLPLGLPEDDMFWSGPAQPWTSKRIWSGEDLPADHALE